MMSFVSAKKMVQKDASKTTQCNLLPPMRQHLGSAKTRGLLDLHQIVFRDLISSHLFPNSFQRMVVMEFSVSFTVLILHFKAKSSSDIQMLTNTLVQVS